jgi:hypothetical protein
MAIKEDETEQKVFQQATRRKKLNSMKKLFKISMQIG